MPTLWATDGSVSEGTRSAMKGPATALAVKPQSGQVSRSVQVQSLMSGSIGAGSRGVVTPQRYAAPAVSRLRSSARMTGVTATPCTRTESTIVNATVDQSQRSSAKAARPRA